MSTIATIAANYGALADIANITFEDDDMFLLTANFDPTNTCEIHDFAYDPTEEYTNILLEEDRLTLAICEGKRTNPVGKYGKRFQRN